MPFEKIETKKKSAYIIEQIVGAIRDGEYSVGQKLPSEREIAEKMGVSRPSVREAFSALQIAGVIDSRSGDGTYIKDSGNWTNMETQALTILEKDEDPFAVWEAREAIECGMVKLIIKNATTEDIEKIKEALENMSKAVNSRDFSSYFRSDQAFHLTLATATHNPFITQTNRSLVNVMRQRLWREIKQKYYLEREGNIQESFIAHERIFAAIKDGELSELGKAMKKHFVKLKEHLK